MDSQSPRPTAACDGSTAVGHGKGVPAPAQAAPPAQTHAARAFTESAVIGTSDESAAAHLANALQLLRVLPDAVWEAEYRALVPIVKRIRRAHELLVCVPGRPPRDAGESWLCSWCGIMHAADVHHCPHFSGSLALVDALVPRCSACGVNPVADGCYMCAACLEAQP